MLVLSDSKVEPQKDWMMQMQVNQIYKEPKLCKEIVKVIHLTCMALKQDVHVFIMSVNLLEEHLNIHDKDLLLTILVIVFICSKTIGEQSDLKIMHLTRIYQEMTSIYIYDNQVSREERNIFGKLCNNMPIVSEVDDLKLFYNRYIEPMNLRRSILSLCLNILELIYINRYNVFMNLKQSYMEINMFETFKNIYSSKFYIICGIIASAFMMTKYENVFDLNGIINDFSMISEIHRDHYEILSKEIVNLIQKKLVNKTTK